VIHIRGRLAARSNPGVFSPESLAARCDCQAHPLPFAKLVVRARPRHCPHLALAAMDTLHAVRSLVWRMRGDLVLSCSLNRSGGPKFALFLLKTVSLSVIHKDGGICLVLTTAHRGTFLYAPRFELLRKTRLLCHYDRRGALCLSRSLPRRIFALSSPWSRRVASSDCWRIAGLLAASRVIGRQIRIQTPAPASLVSQYC